MVLGKSINQSIVFDDNLPHITINNQKSREKLMNESLGNIREVATHAELSPSGLRAIKGQGSFDNIVASTYR